MIYKSIAEEAADCRSAWAGFGVGTLAHCCHHGIHIEKLTEPPENRIAYILGNKPKIEQPIRLRHFRPWTAKADAARTKAYADWTKADAARTKAYADWTKAYAARTKAYADWTKAYADWTKAYADFQASKQFQEDHARLFPECAWNGNGIL